MTEDITYCSNNKCGYLRCERNQKHIKLLIPHNHVRILQHRLYGWNETVS